MKLLTLDTSTSACSVALTVDQRLVAEIVLGQEKTLSSKILVTINAVLTNAGFTVADMDGIAVAVGPGSFTALRVGVATAKGLALAATKPVVGFSSLAMLAMNIPFSAYPVCPMFDARKNEVYTALYRCGADPDMIIPPCVISPAAFLPQINGPTIFVGDGALKYRELICAHMGENAFFAPSHCHVPRASAGATLAESLFSGGKTVPPAILNPVYIRPSEAELAKKQREI